MNGSFINHNKLFIDEKHTTTMHLHNKDGSINMKIKENRDQFLVPGFKLDGTPDRRFSANKKTNNLYY